MAHGVVFSAWVLLATPGMGMLGGRRTDPNKVSGSANGDGEGAGPGMPGAPTLVLSCDSGGRSAPRPWQRLFLSHRTLKLKGLLEWRPWLQEC